MNMYWANLCFAISCFFITNNSSLVFAKQGSSVFKQCHFKERTLATNTRTGWNEDRILFDIYREMIFFSTE